MMDRTSSIPRVAPASRLPGRHILVAGASGVLGRALVPILIRAGHRVTATTREPAKAGWIRGLGAVPFVLDAFGRDEVARAMTHLRPDLVIDLMTDLSSGNSASNARLRVLGTRHLVDAARAAGTTEMLAASISWAYCPGPEPATEPDCLDIAAVEPRRTTVLGVQAMESAVLEMPRGAVLRFGQLYGAGTWFSREGLVGKEARAGRLRATETVTSFIHVTDAACAIRDALEWGHGVWNIVDEEPAPGYEWAPAFASAVGGVPPLPALSGDAGRPVSNARAIEFGLRLTHRSWRDGFATL